MASVQTSLADYLRNTYRPDCDFVDGEVQERNLDEFDHAAVQGLSNFLVLPASAGMGAAGAAGDLHRVAEQRVRITDVCPVSRSQPVEQVLTKPPLAVIEILSPEDSISRATTNG